MLADLWLRAPILLAGIFALALSTRRAGLLPVGAALLASLALDALRAAVRLPREVGAAIYLAPLALGVWVTLRTLAPGVARPGLIATSGLSAVSLLVPVRAQPPAALFIAVLVEVAVAARGTALLRGSVAARCALALVAGDALGLLGPAGPLPWPAGWRASAWAAAAQASVASAGVIAILWRDTRLRD